MGFIQEQARKLSEKLMLSAKEFPKLERTPDETASDLLLFMREGGFKELEEIASGVGIQADLAEHMLEGMAKESYAKKGYRLTEKTLEFAGVVEDIRSLPEPE